MLILETEPFILETESFILEIPSFILETPSFILETQKITICQYLYLCSITHKLNMATNYLTSAQ